MYQNNNRTVPHQLPHLLRPLLQEQDSQFVRDVNSNRRFEDTAILLTATIYKLTRCHIKPKTPHTLKNTSSKNSNLTNTRFLRPLTLTPLTWKIWWAPNNTSKWQIRFNSEFRGLNWTYKKLQMRVTSHFISSIPLFIAMDTKFLNSKRVIPCVWTSIVFCTATQDHIPA